MEATGTGVVICTCKGVENKKTGTPIQRDKDVL